MDRSRSPLRILRRPSRVPEDLRRGVAALGNFDGVHKGHQAVIGAAGAIAAEAGAPLVVVTFEPHPRSFFRPDDPPFRLTPFRVKAERLAGLRATAQLVLRFDAALARHTAEAFVEEVLVDMLDIRHVVVGNNFAFGRDRGGNAALLRGYAGRFDCTEVAPVAGGDGVAYSSTVIRRHLAEGRPQEAAAALGRPFEITGRVVRGQCLGHEIGFPTANLRLGAYLRPAFGIYAVRVALDGGDGSGDGDGFGDGEGPHGWRDGAANLGIRPAIDGGTGELLLEPHIFDFDGDLYGRRLRVALIGFLRPEGNFDTLEAMRLQIADDCVEARRTLAGVPASTKPAATKPAARRKARR